jgi:phage shock protein PspC (stress-responsive transcriptional regulator)
MQWNLQDLRRSDTDLYVEGICGGLGEHTPVPAWLWRALFVVVALCWGAGLAVYAALWVFMPPALSRQKREQ